MTDKKGIPICEGDLVRTFHFIGARRKKHYLYHVAVMEGSVMYLVPTAHLVPRLVSGGGKAPLSIMSTEWRDMEVIHGSGPGNCLSYEDRPKVRMNPARLIAPHVPSLEPFAVLVRDEDIEGAR